ncbi:hypothetical protein SYNPS1DRAFT_16217 [Syncephalis pseudoplumigaleata]|uniref:COX assembly mitochondrial protein n=1 Tax=Syncephalis pseudoplumigaleata TaxID=1712513 RepID=A0A4V1J1H2_9FUNG|nr:hypothetical protein SYNPS1DRAFT_16217 [Syncephalis pseudoplumigaleata]|eukprot:RKP25049.1 hypothetical protein SYNPS1DRAFT_16217 [Syncephalis pseudoplumigaleata]
MHPHVYEHKNPNCAELIRQLEECHARGLWSKLTNECGGLKDALNACLAAEFNENRKTNTDEARKRRQRVRELWKELDEDK